MEIKKFKGVIEKKFLINQNVLRQRSPPQNILNKQKQRGNHIKDKHIIKILNWNVSSIKNETYTEIKKEQCHIICLQETRGKKINDSQSFTYYQKFGQTDRQGGVVIGIHKCFCTNDISNKYLCFDKEDCEFLALNVRNEMMNIILFNFYFHNRQLFNKNKIKLQQAIEQTIQNMKKNQILIVYGDFNSKKVKIENLYQILQDNDITFKRKNENTYKQSKTNEILIFPKLDYSYQLVQTDISDHFKIILICEFELIQDKKDFMMKYNKSRAYQLNKEAEIKSNNFEEFYQYIKSNLRKRKIIEKHRIRIPIIKIKIKTLQNMIKQIAINFENNDQQYAFKMMKSIKNLNPNKKEGGIMKFCLNEKGELIGGRLVLRECFKQMDIISKRIKYQQIKLPFLPELNIQQIKELQKLISNDKAIGIDGISDKAIKQCKKYQFLQNLWNQNTLDINHQLCEARLTPLNKAYPNIPKNTQFRPITIFSALFQFMELRFKNQIDQFLTLKVSNKQNGFVRNGGTQVNIFSLIKLMNSLEKKNNIDIIFIDFSNAYNTVNRVLLFEILNRKQVLKEDEIDFLQALYNQIYYADPINKQKYCFQNGLPQGSILSPGLFNIYLDDMLIQIKQEFQSSYEDFQYADDLVFIIQHQKIKQFLEILIRKSEIYNLKINKEKSAIIRYKNQMKEGRIMGFPIVQKYIYLGISINRLGNLKDHTERLINKVKYITNQLSWMTQDMSFKKKYICGTLSLNLTFYMQQQQ